MWKRRTVVVQVPAHRRGKVASLSLESPEPIAVTYTPQRPVSPLGQLSVMVGMAAFDFEGVGANSQSLGDELANGFEHRRPGAVVCDIQRDEAVTGQRVGQIERPVLVEAGDRGGGLYHPTVHQHGHGLEQGTFDVV